jgi:uncharacterized protein YbbC (DUF1343 family)
MRYPFLSLLKIALLFLVILFGTHTLQAQSKAGRPIPAAYLTHKYVSLLREENVALVVNQTSTIYNTHLVDTLRSLGIELRCIFSPEHGFRGTADAGERISDSVDQKTNIPIRSLYGKKKKPSAEDLKGITMVVFDIQDVGVRFYTYLSTLHYVMEACAENNIRLMVLDRPNPNGNYIDGPCLKKEFTSFVGMHPGVPVVYGMTIGEYARMINDEGWLSNKRRCELMVMRCANYTHESYYTLPIKPSPNLVDATAIALYPSLCFFEGTAISVGRGTYDAFKQIGHPSLKNKYSFSFQPESIAGMSKEPPFENQLCYGLSLSNYYDEKRANAIELKWLIEFYNAYPQKDKFFNSFFEKLAGNASLRKQIIAKTPEKEIRKSWEKDLESFKAMRSKYLMYP